MTVAPNALTIVLTPLKCHQNQKNYRNPPWQAAPDPNTSSPSFPRPPLPPGRAMRYGMVGGCGVLCRVLCGGGLFPFEVLFVMVEGLWCCAGCCVGALCFPFFVETFGSSADVFDFVLLNESQPDRAPVVMPPLAGGLLTAAPVFNSRPPRASRLFPIGPSYRGTPCSCFRPFSCTMRSFSPC